MSTGDRSNTSAVDSWFFAGLASTFPNIVPSSISTSDTSQKTKLSDPQPRVSDDLTTSNDHANVPACRIFQTSDSPPLNLTPEEALGSVGLKEPVLVFQYRGKFYAIDHKCPHRSFPLSRGTLHDIEDFGIVLSAGITCPKHGWAFDLHTGESDRGRYQLEVWEVEVRERQLNGSVDDNTTSVESVREVWVRKKRKI